MTRTPLSERDPFRVGLVAIAAGAVIGLVVLLLSVVSFGTDSYTAELEHTAGLRPGEDVQVHGVPVGEVTDVVVAGDRVLVTFTVDSGIGLGARTTAAVKVATLLGTHYLQVDPQGGGSLADGRIPLERTVVPYNLQDVLETGTRRLEDLDAEVLAEALTEASRTLTASGDELGPALQGVGRLSEVVVRRADQTSDLLRSARRIADQLAASTGDIVGLMEQTTLVVREVTSRQSAIERLLLETRALSNSLTGIVADTEDDLRPSLRDLDTALASLRRQSGTLERVLEVMAPAVRYVANATGNGPFLDLYVREPALPADDARCRLGDCG